jgi:hypothetical protein
MEERSGSERGNGTRRGLSASVLALLLLIAVVGGVGIVISLGRHMPQTTSSPGVPSVPLLPRATPGVVGDDPQSGLLFSVADDLATHDVVLFGGVGDYDNTWLWNGERWAHAHPATSPPGRYGASAAYDPATKMVLIFGGRTEPGTPIHDTWGWDGTRWVDLDSGAGGPPPGEGSSMAWDSAHNQMVLLTGSGVIGEPGGTWVWAGSHWSHPDGAELPAGAFYSPMWFDPEAKSLIAVGCCEGPPPATGAVMTTWRWSGKAWSVLTTPADAPVGATTMALDPRIDALVLCTCSSTASGRRPALLVWDGHAWTSMTSGALPVEGGTEITDADRNELLLLGSPVANTVAGAVPVQVWTLIGSNWRRVDGANA